MRRNDRRFSFMIMGLPADTFSVVSFKGKEGLSSLYRFELELASSNADLDLDDVMDGMGVLGFHSPTDKLRVQGIMARFEQQHAVDGCVFYKGLLVPRLWGLTLSHHNQIFLDKSAPEFLSEILTESGILNAKDFEFRLTRDYPKREYVCQYDESHYDFFARWLEREGMYYYFEQSEGGEKLIITDNIIAHTLAPGHVDLEYMRARGLDVPTRENIVHYFASQQNTVPKKVRVRDYNYRSPSLELQGESEVSGEGMGEVYFWGDNCKTPDEARRQAAVRAEEARVPKARYMGRSTAPFLSAGHTFRLVRHFKESNNKEYLTLTVEHKGNQTGYLLAGLGRSLSDREAKNFYENRFTAIAADVQYRHPRTTVRRRFYGIISGVVDAAGEGKYAELDDQGRYKVRLPFDVSGRKDGKASCWIRMASPYGGEGHGMHFPLLKGTEVLVSFTDGDLDRPVIVNAVPNFEKRSVVKNANAPVNAIRSASGNQLAMGDKEGQEFIGLFSPFHNSGIAVGSVKPGGGGSIALSTSGEFEKFTAGAESSATFGAKNEFTCGISNEIYVGIKNELTAAISFAATLATKVEYAKGPAISLGQEATSLKNEISQVGLNSVTLAGGISGAVSNLVSKANSLLGKGMAASALAGAGIVGMSAPFGEDFLKDASVEWKKGAFVLGLSGLLLGGAWTLGAATGIKELVEKFEAMESRARTAALTLSRTGVEIGVNSVVGPNGRFFAEVAAMGPTSTALQRSSIEIGTRASTITLTNKGNASVTLSNGTSIALKIAASEATLNDSGVELKKNGGGSLKLSSQNVSLESLAPATPGKLTLAASSAKLQAGNDAIEVTPNGLKLTFLGGQLHAGPLAINAAGIIQLG